MISRFPIILLIKICKISKKHTWNFIWILFFFYNFQIRTLSNFNTLLCFIFHMCVYMYCHHVNYIFIYLIDKSFMKYFFFNYQSYNLNMIRKYALFLFTFVLYFISFSLLRWPVLLIFIHLYNNYRQV